MPNNKKPAFGRDGQYNLTPQSTSLPKLNQPNYKKEFLHAMLDHGINCQESLLADGEIHRFARQGRGNKDCWYVFYEMAGAFGDWSRDIHEKWSINRGNLTCEESEILQKQIQEAQAKLQEEVRSCNEEAAQQARSIWEQAQTEGSSAYLTRKKVDPIGIRFDGSTVIIPLQDGDGKLWSLQYIHENGHKRFLKGGRKKGCHHLLGGLDQNARQVIVVEGYATGASVYMATRTPTLIAFDAGNLESVVAGIKQKYLRLDIVLAADNDCWPEDGKNIGLEAAKKVATKHACQVIWPTFSKNAVSAGQHPTDFNDLHVLEGLEEVKRQLEQILSKKRLKSIRASEFLKIDFPPREMILSPILSTQGLAMIYAKRGLGKTFLGLSIGVAVATNHPLFDGKWQPSKARKVLFVDGEMPAMDLQERIRALAKGYACEDSLENLEIITPDMQDSLMPDLSTAEGQASLEENLEGKDLLILDNLSALCRAYKENDANSWVPILEWLLQLKQKGLTVLLIHHANKSGQQRGTSRKEDALDVVLELRALEDHLSSQGAHFEMHFSKARHFAGEQAHPFGVTLKEEEDGALVWEIRNLENEIEEKILLLSQEGLSQREIAAEKGISLSKVNRILRKQKQHKGGH